MFRLQELLAVALPPKDPNFSWLEQADRGVDYLRNNACSNEIVIFTNAGQSFVHAVLVPLSNVSPPDEKELQYAHINPCDQWALEHVSGGGKPDRMHLKSPLDRIGCKSLEGGQQLVFRRTFTDVDTGPPRTELSQPLVQALDLYWLKERKAYCRLNEEGDVEPTIRLRELSAETGEPGAMLVTIEAEQLHRYMAVTETALLIKFDFTRVQSGSFAGWIGPFAKKSIRTTCTTTQACKREQASRMAC